MFEKIIVIGCPGSGKSTFARSLNELTGLPLHHLDMIWHKPDKTNVSRDEFDQRLNDIIKSDRWIIDGNYQRTLDIRLQACDTVFLLDYPLDVCLDGARSRVGKKRLDTPWVETEFDSEFEQWILDFPSKNLPLIYDSLENYRDKNIVVFKSREQASKYLDELKEKLSD